MTFRRLCLLFTALSVCAIAHANTLLPAEITRSTEPNLSALTGTLVGLTALGLYLSFRKPFSAAPKSQETTQE